MLSKFIVNNKVFLRTIFIFGTRFGIQSFLSIPKESNPSVNIPLYVVTTISPWNDPKTVEQQITNKLEDWFKSISKIKKIESNSTFNMSTVIVEFYESKIKTEALNDIKTTIDANINAFPVWTQYSLIKQVSPDDAPVYVFSIAWPYLNNVIYQKAETLENKIKSIVWISSLDIIGKPQKKILINIDYNKIQKYNLDVSYIIQSLQSSIFKVPADKKSINWALYSYEFTSYDPTIEDITKLLLNYDVISNEWYRIKLSDIAEVNFEEQSYNKKNFIIPDISSWTSLNWISFQVKLTPWSDVESVITQVKAQIDEFWKINPELTIYETQSRLSDISEMFATFLSNFRQTWLLVMIFVFIFLWLQASIGIWISFPLVYLFTFIYLNLVGYNFNNIVSFSLVLTLGIMVDNLIVVTEWIIEQYKSWVTDYWQAIQNTFDKYLVSLLWWTATTIAIFLPINFMLEWMIWQFIQPLSVTITWTLLVSLVVSLIVLPLLAEQFLSKKEGFEQTKWNAYLEVMWTKISDFVSKLTKTKKRSLSTVIWSWLMLFASFSLVALWIIKADFLPTTDQNNLWVNMKYKQWISLSQSQEYTKTIVDEIDTYLNEAYPGSVEFLTVDLWSQYSSDTISRASLWSSENLAYITITLVDWTLRNNKSFEIWENLQTYIQNKVSKKYDFLEEVYAITSSAWIWWWKAVWFYLIAEDISKLSDYAELIKPDIEKINWIFNITNNLEYTNWKISYKVNVNKAKELWINPQSASLLLAWIKNSEYLPRWIPIKSMSDINTDTVDIFAYINYNQNINSLQIGKIFFDQIIEETRLLPEIKNYQHIDWDLQIVIQADKLADIPLWEITVAIENIIKKYPLPDWIRFRSWSNMEEQEQTSGQLGSAFMIGFLLMFLILVLLFKNIKYTVVIMTSTLLSFIGILITLAIFWLPLSFPAQLWLFGVIWVWINNAILFVDSYMTNKDTLWIKESLLFAIQSRFAPIFLTTATTVTGLITLALKDELRWSMAMTFIWWLLMNVVIVLLYTPCIIMLLDYKTQKKTD